MSGASVPVVFKRCCACLHYTARSKVYLCLYGIQIDQVFVSGEGKLITDVY